jgi:hypothetical protein
MARTKAHCAIVTLTFVLLLFSAVAPARGAVCGDGVIDANELCDDGAANGTDACCTAVCTRVDSDHDGICDADEPCPSPAPLLAGATATINGFSTASADDTFRLTGTLAPSAAVDPAADGVAILLSNRFSGTFVYASIPGGAGWTRSPRGGWVYRDPRGTVDGVTYVSIRPAAATPERLLLVVEGRHGDYARNTDIRPLHVAVALAASSADREQCGETYLALSRCAFSRSGGILRCTPPPPQRRCSSSEPDARVRCDAQNAAAAQETYFTTHGTHYSGACADLPGFTPSAGVLCLTIGADVVYTVVTTSPASTISCVYSSVPASGQPSLVCS